MDKVTLPRRFYKTATAERFEEAWTVHLDARPLKTPAKSALVLPTHALALAIAEEWNSQGDTLALTAMTLTRLANVAIDRTPATRAELAEEVTRYAETDVTCFLAEGPTPLRERQDAAWRPWREWVGQCLGVLLVPVEGLTASPQPQASLDKVRAHALALDDFRLTGLTWGCSLFGSAVFALGVEQGVLAGPEALALSCVDEDWQREQWGDDSEAASARQNRAKEAEALEVWFSALRQD